MAWGGTNPPTATASKVTYLSSILTFASRMRRAGVDVELSNHAFADYGLERMEELRAASDGPDHPFVLGTFRAQRFMKGMENMLRGRIAQDQEADSGTPGAPAVTTAAPYDGLRLLTAATPHADRSVGRSHTARFRRGRGGPGWAQRERSLGDCKQVISRLTPVPRRQLWRGVGQPRQPPGFRALKAP
jgi:hypothetical protein